MTTRDKIPVEALVWLQVLAGDLLGSK
jgi:hypothetical protein